MTSGFAPLRDKINHRGPQATAAIVVAMEAARGAMILKNILPGKEDLIRGLPRPSDLDGASRWVADIADRVPATQVVWIIHSAPDRIHHIVIGPGLLHYQFAPSKKRKLELVIDRLMTCWSEGDLALECSITSGEFEESLEKIAEQIGINGVITGLPQQVRRIAIVAGGELSDIPFAALPTPGTTEPLGLRYALSDLPCLSARLPLHQRSVRRRGEKLLLVSPPAAMLTPAAGRAAHTVLDGEHATAARLQETLKLHRHRQVRIDSHGQHEHADAIRSWLQLAPEGLDGRLWAQDLQQMDLSSCGTLVLGACESGMAKRAGRDERVGFVRAALSAGAAAVVAARWIAADPVAATVLDRFERYVRYLPRDLALQQAQLDVYRRAPGTPANVPTLEHPARWACWTLYGDSSWQTGARPVRRSLRRSLDQRRRHG
jgi:CHAT domain-containing protein